MLFMELVDDLLDNLLLLFNDYQDIWQVLQCIDGQIEVLYVQVCLKGVVKFDSEDDIECCLKLLINVYVYCQDEVLMLVKVCCVVVIDIVWILCNICSDYDNLEYQLVLFNCEINKCQVFNLQSFCIVFVLNKDVFKYIDQIIYSVGQYEEGENFLVFDLIQSVEQDVKNEEVKEYLVCLVVVNYNQLGLKDLFELVFEIIKVNGQLIMYIDIDGVVFNGIIMIIKVLINMYLLLYLMDCEQVGCVCLFYYLDEVVDIDECNQVVLLEISL